MTEGFKAAISIIVFLVFLIASFWLIIVSSSAERECREERKVEWVQNGGLPSEASAYARIVCDKE